MGDRIRLQMDVQVEMIDPIAAAAANMNWTTDESGAPAMTQRADVDEVAQAVEMVVVQALAAMGPELGFRPVAAGLTARPQVADANGEYPPPA